MIRRRHFTLCATFLLTLQASLATPRVRSAEPAKISLPITATAKVVATARIAPQVSPMQMAPLARPPVEPTLPDGKLPQYQLGYHQRDVLTANQRETGTLLLKLEMPPQRLIIKATIHIDGRPFPLARERRVASMLASSQAPLAVSDHADEPDETIEKLAVDSPQADSLEVDPSDVDSPEVDPSDVDPSDAAEVVIQPPTIEEYRMATDPVEMLRRYADAIGEPIELDEARWLLVHWSAGPELLLLNHYFQSFRGSERPVFHILDRDRDGVISAEEFERAVESFNECDTNGDGIVDVAEIQRAAKDPRRSPAGAAGGPAAALLGLLDDSDAQADVELLIDFDSASPDDSRISLVSVAPAIQADLAKVEQSGHTITMYLNQTPIAFSAVQDAASDQISIGGVVDGYPLLPIVDPNNDGRFTVRELRTLVERLKQFDSNLDGRLTMDEVVATTRVCFGRGATVHRELANLRDVPTPPASEPVDLPEWFVRMDRNQDNDLTRGEFPGTDEQFRSLDIDGDELISAAEAIAYEQQSSPKADE